MKTLEPCSTLEYKTLVRWSLVVSMVFPVITVDCPQQTSLLLHSQWMQILLYFLIWVSGSGMDYKHFIRIFYQTKKEFHFILFAENIVNECEYLILITWLVSQIYFQFINSFNNLDPFSLCQISFLNIWNVKKKYVQKHFNLNMKQCQNALFPLILGNSIMHIYTSGPEFVTLPA